METKNPQLENHRLPHSDPLDHDELLSDLTGLSSDLDRVLADDAIARAVIAGAIEGSGYLKNLIRRLPDFAGKIFLDNADDLFERVKIDTASCWSAAGTSSEVMKR